MKKFKTLNIFIISTFILLLIIVINSQIELFKCKENVQITRILKKSEEFSQIAKLLSTYSRFKELISIEEYFYCVLESEIKILESGKYEKFIKSEISSKDLRAVTNEQFDFNLSIIKLYLQNSVNKRDCDFWGKEN